MSAGYLGGLHCSVKYLSLGPLRVPLGELSVRLECDFLISPSDSVHVRPNILPFGMGYYTQKLSKWHSLSPIVDQSSRDQAFQLMASPIVILHLIGDSTTEAVFKTLRRSCATKVAELGCMRTPLRWERPCQSHFRNCRSPALGNVTLELAFTLFS